MSARCEQSLPRKKKIVDKQNLGVKINHTGTASCLFFYGDYLGVGPEIEVEKRMMLDNWRLSVPLEGEDV